MQPGDGFWEGVGASVGSSPGWMVIGALLVVGVLFVVAKYIYPGHKELKMRELGIREREAENDAERIRANSALAEQMAALRASNEQIAAQNASVIGRFDESASHSREMGAKVDHIDDTTQHTEGMVKDIHRLMMGGVGKEGK